MNIIKKGEKKTPSQARDLLTAVKDIAYPFLNEVSADSWRNSSHDLQAAFNKFFKGLANHPKTKNRKSKLSFYHDNRKLQVEKKRVRLERIGWVKIKSDQPIPLGHYKKDNINSLSINNRRAQVGLLRTPEIKRFVVIYG